MRAVRTMPRDGMDGVGMGIEDIFNMQGEINDQRDEALEKIEDLAPIEENIEPEVSVVDPDPVAEPEREDKSVPLPTFLDMRDKQKEAERRAAEAERRLAELEASKQEQQAPDPFDDPQGYRAYQSRQVQEAVIAQKFDMSDLIARQAHGDEAVEAATTWAAEKAKANPAFASEYMKERHPIDWIVRQHKRDSLMSQVGEDMDEFVRRRAAELGLIAPAAQAVEPQQVATPARSLASTPSKIGAVKDVPVGPMTALNTLFK